LPSPTTHFTSGFPYIFSNFSKLERNTSGAGFLRGGAFKPRTSPYSFQGLREDGLKLLVEAKKETANETEKTTSEE
jgi:3-deoxy-D-arabino-heptulosonate 7-phosphate (DAHP) synthase